MAGLAGGAVTLSGSPGSQRALGSNQSDGDSIDVCYSGDILDDIWLVSEKDCLAQA